MCLDLKLKVNEIFMSIQGESTFVGLPCAFIRLCGCNLRCSYCDTTYAYDKGKYMEINSICEAISGYGTDLVCLTGGEPLFQNASSALVRELCDKGYTVLIETNGSLRIDSLPEEAIRIMDIKCPDSGMSDNMDWNNIPLLKAQDEVKFVLSSRNDYKWAKDVVSRFGLTERVKLLFSAVEGRLDPGALSQWILDDKLKVRLQIQLHKYIFKEDRAS